MRDAASVDASHIVIPPSRQSMPSHQLQVDRNFIALCVSAPKVPPPILKHASSPTILQVLAYAAPHTQTIVRHALGSSCGACLSGRYALQGPAQRAVVEDAMTARTKSGSAVHFLARVVDRLHVVRQTALASELLPAIRLLSLMARRCPPELFLTLAQLHASPRKCQAGQPRPPAHDCALYCAPGVC